MTRELGMQLFGKQGMFLVVVAAIGALAVGQTELPPQVCFLMGLVVGASVLLFLKSNAPSSSSLPTNGVDFSSAAASQPASVVSGESVTLYVGNIAYQSQESDLFDLFSSHGQVKSVRILTDRNTHRSRGFGFVEMDASGAKAALSMLDGFEFNGRNLRVTSANDR